MEPSLPIGTRVVAKRGLLAVGTIVVFYPSEGLPLRLCGPKPHAVTPGGEACDASIPTPEKLALIKRIVGAPGDEIYVRGGRVYRKPVGASGFRAEQDSYTKACRGGADCNFPTPITIAAGHWFLMGDNRGESDDSRTSGPVPTSWIIGTVTQ
jgi:signal peptidase I